MMTCNSRAEEDDELKTLRRGGRGSVEKLRNEIASTGAPLCFCCTAEDIIITAETAGRAIMNIYESDTSRWEVEIKADSSPVTVADREANRVICDALQVSSSCVELLVSRQPLSVQGSLCACCNTLLCSDSRPMFP